MFLPARPGLMILLAGAVILTGLPDPRAASTRDSGWGPIWHAAAWAGADDDDDDDDDDNGRARLRRQAPPRQVAPPAPLPISAPELIVADLSPADLQILLDEGFTLIETLPLAGLAMTLQRLSAPLGQALGEARDRVRQLPSGAAADLNHYYRTGQVAEPVAAAAPDPDPAPPCLHGNCASQRLVEWPDAARRAMSCPIDAPIGIIDTGVNTAHEFLSGARIELVDLGVQANPSAQVHGTAIVSLLAGQDPTRVGGLLPEAELIVADIFTRAGDDERADVAALLRGLDAMEQRDLRLVNLSLAGPDNSVVQAGIDRLVAERGMVLVAAAGNGGPHAPPAYPAAYEGVIAVTAVDNRGRIHSDAQRGDHIDLAAPGVGLLLATSISGARPQTGTSFATPHVTAAAALVLAREPELTPAQVALRLTDAARDLGAAGHDPIFGHGLLLAGELCEAD